MGDPAPSARVWAPILPALPRAKAGAGGEGGGAALCKGGVEGKLGAHSPQYEEPAVFFIGSFRLFGVRFSVQIREEQFP